MYKKYFEKLNELITVSHRKLLDIADAEKCRITEVPGDNGVAYALVENKYVELGRDQSKLRKVIVLAHELGHILDYKKNPMLQAEWDIVNGPVNLIKDSAEAMGRLIELMGVGVKNWMKSHEYYEREKSAWEFAEQILQDTGLLKMDMAKKNFEDLKRSKLRSYYRIMKKHQSAANVKVG